MASSPDNPQDLTAVTRSTESLGETEVNAVVEQVGAALVKDAAHVEAVAVAAVAKVKADWKASLAWLVNKIKVWGPWVAGIGGAVAHYALGLF